MKNLIAFIALVMATVTVFAGTTVLIGSLTTVNGTSNTASYAIGSFTVPRGSFTMLNDGSVTNTNSVTINLQFSMDNTNWLNFATYHPSAVGVSNELFTPPYTNMIIYLRGQAITTNPIGLGGLYNY